MLPGLEMMACTDLAVPLEVMQHVVKVESSLNQFAIGVVGGHLARQPKNLAEAVSTSQMLEREGYNFSLGIAQVNRYNLSRHGLSSYERAFDICPNLQAGSKILAECYLRSGSDWGRAFSCYYSGNFTTGFQHGYVDKVMASWRDTGNTSVAQNAIPVIRNGSSAAQPQTQRLQQRVDPAAARLLRRIEEAALSKTGLPAATTQPNEPGLPAQPPLNSEGMPSGYVDDSPVVVQAMGVPTSATPATAKPTQTAGNAAAAATAPTSQPQRPVRDSALVF